MHGPQIPAEHTDSLAKFQRQNAVMAAAPLGMLLDWCSYTLPPGLLLRGSQRFFPASKLHQLRGSWSPLKTESLGSWLMGPRGWQGSQPSFQGLRPEVETAPRRPISVFRSGLLPARRPHPRPLAPSAIKCEVIGWPHARCNWKVIYAEIN